MHRKLLVNVTTASLKFTVEVINSLFVYYYSNPPKLTKGRIVLLVSDKL